MRSSDLTTLVELLDRFSDDFPDVADVPRVRAQVAKMLDGADRGPCEPVRAQELADLRRTPLGNALFTRDSFETEYGHPELIGETREIDLAGADPADMCIYCNGERFTLETYATDRTGTSVRFWWCHRCGLGRAVSWGALRDVTSIDHQRMGPAGWPAQG